MKNVLLPRSVRLRRISLSCAFAMKRVTLAYAVCLYASILIISKYNIDIEIISLKMLKPHLPELPLPAASRRFIRGEILFHAAPVNATRASEEFARQSIQYHILIVISPGCVAARVPHMLWLKADRL